MTVTRESHVVIVPDVVFNEVDGETVLLSGERGRYYGLDRVGTRIWALLRVEPRLAAVHTRLIEEFDAPADRLWADLARLVEELQQKGLVEVHGPDAS
jgi:hypothetical protein